MKENETYHLQLSETFQRFYDSPEPVLVRNEVTEYPLEKGTEIPTSCGFLEISDCTDTSARLDYYDDDGALQSAEVTPDRRAHVRFIEGEGGIYRISDCTFQLVKN